MVQIITPGTIFDESLTNNKNNYIAALEEFDFTYTLAFCDITTGEFSVVNIEKKEKLLLNQLETMAVKEIVTLPNYLHHLHTIIIMKSMIRFLAKSMI